MSDEHSIRRVHGWASIAGGNMRKAIAWSIVTVMTTTTFAMTTSIASVGASNTEDEQWASPFSAAAGLHGIEMMEAPGARTNVSLLTGKTAAGDRICSSLNDQSCTGDVDFQAVLAPCATATSVDCIESVTATNAIGASATGEFSRQFPSRGVNDYSGSAVASIPDGNSPGLWNIAGFQHSNGSLYHVAVQVAGRRVGGSATTAARSIAATITPVSIRSTNCDVQFHGTCLDQFSERQDNGRYSIGFAGVALDQDLGIRCVGWAENGACALKHAFPDGMRIRLSVRLSTVPGGWLHGRMSDPTASITTSRGVTTMVVEAAPTDVPAVAAAVQWGQLPTSIQSWFTANCPGACGTRIPGSLELPAAQRNAVSVPESYRESSFDQLELWNSVTGDKASAVPSYWSVRTLSGGEMQAAPSCIRNASGVTGIVSTNATLYSEGPPSYDRSSKTLNYKVAAPHYLADGSSEFMGRYDLLLRPDIASCLYGVNDLAVTSDIDVVGADGVEQPVNVAMVRSAQWFKFSAAGYTHSAPVIKVKLAKLEPTLRRSRSMALTTLRKRVGLTPPKGARIVTTVARSSSTRCAVRGPKLVALKKTGVCKVTVTVTPRATKKVPKPKSVKRTIVVRVR